jgi:5-(carboxyamino)imidazole ribonucleotide synthase
MNKPRVGILGGGQLARMLCLEGHKLNLEMHVLSGAANDPAAQVTQHWHAGDLENSKDLQNFFSKVDVVTFESEFLSQKVLLEAEAHSKIELHPRVGLISELSDRLKQKAWLERFDIPTSRFSGLLSKEDVFQFLQGGGTNHLGTKNYVTVFKKRRFGYDGYGTVILKGEEKIKTWVQTHQDTLSDYIIEDFQKFKRELAVQFAISRNGDVMIYPLIEWKAQDSRCLWVKGPTKTRFTSPFNQLLKKIKVALLKSGYVGVIAFELFETQKGLVVNEAAPRVHNSAHYTLEALAMNQFKAHLCSVLGYALPLKPKLVSNGFAMMNILGRSSSTHSKPSKKSSRDMHPEFAEDVFVHWYGKGDFREGRKMGHITCLAKNSNQALQLALKTRGKMQF